MTIHFNRPFVKQYRQLPALVRQKIDKQIQQLMRDPHHPSLRVKKMINYPHIWEARVDGQYRMTFELHDTIIQMRKVGTHEIYRNP